MTVATETGRVLRGVILSEAKDLRLLFCSDTQ